MSKQIGLKLVIEETMLLDALSVASIARRNTMGVLYLMLG